MASGCTCRVRFGLVLLVAFGKCNAYWEKANTEPVCVKGARYQRRKHPGFEIFGFWNVMAPSNKYLNQSHNNDRYPKHRHFNVVLLVVP